MSLNRIYEIVVLICFLYSVYLWIYKRKSKQQFYFFVYLLLIIGVDIIPVNLSSWIEFDRNNLFFGYIILSLIYFSTIYFKSIHDRVFRISIICFSCLLIIFNLMEFQTDIKQLSFTSIISLPLLFIFLSMTWFIYKLKNVDDKSIIENFLFWISSGILIWSVFFIFRAIPMYFLQKNDSQLLSFLTMTFSIVNVMIYLLFLIGLIFTQNERTSRRN
ncbi:hypothetical protein DRF65_24945 [Chryseobacterium pennae]|uniref:Uncharacterized protein n=1 Tax=Chryseobacterium pennae TaxID=2258962 RepID=A0A3D9C1A0_9FLAO|nr:hypothetical protein [Chryseobacterium sp. BIGb0232]REC59645.1 hypothetical protein DRF65_24945 [Chryseobacterium pennae]ROS14751.1 hypothetical protein EDF65_3534 [Chryseobacterium nakagawai]